MKKTILLIDDNKDIHYQTKTIVEKAGYNFISSYNSDDGSNKIKAFKPDLIILDYLMPGKNGIELYQELKALPDFNVPVIMLTGVNHTNSEIKKLLEAGINLYLEKPFGTKELLNIIENVFVTNYIQIKNSELRKTIESSKNFFENLLECCPLLIITANESGRITFVNKIVENLLEINADKIVGMHINNVFKYKFPIPSETENEYYHIEEDYFKKKQGSKISLGITYSYLRDYDERIRGILIVAQDLTAHKQLEKDLLEKERLKAITESLATLNHEINNPLTPILGNIQLIRKDDNQFKENHKQKLRVIETNAKKISEIIKTFTQISNTETKKYYGDIKMLKI